MRRRIGTGLSGVNFEMAAKRIKSAYPRGILVYESGVQRRGTVWRYRFGNHEHMDGI